RPGRRGVALHRRPRAVADAHRPASHLPAQHRLAPRGRTLLLGTGGPPASLMGNRGWLHAPCRGPTRPCRWPYPLPCGGVSDELPEQMRIRREKLDRLRAEGVDPYPVNFPRTTTHAEVREKYQGLEPDTATG